MKPSLKLALGLALFALPSLHAANVTYTYYTATGAADTTWVSVAGYNSIVAGNFGGGDATFGGVTWKGGLNPSAGGVGINYSAPGVAWASQTTGFYSGGPALLNAGGYSASLQASGVDYTIALSGLTVGRDYMVQFVLADNRDNTGHATILAKGANVTGDSARTRYSYTDGQFAVITASFTADATTASFQPGQRWADDVPAGTFASGIQVLMVPPVPTKFVNEGAAAQYNTAALNTDVQSYFRLGGAIQDHVTISATDGLSVVAGTAPKHLINITQEGTITPGTYPLIDYAGTIGGLQFAGLKLGSLGRLAGSLVNNVVDTTIDLEITGGAPGDITWTGANGVAWDVETTANWKFTGTDDPTTYFNGDGVRFDDDADAGGVTLSGVVTPRDVEIINDTLAYTFSGTGISGSTTIWKGGPGTATFNNPNSHTGGTTINEGILRLGTGGTLGSGTMSDNGSLEFDNSTDMAFANFITGSGTVTKSNSGTLTLSNANFYQGETLVNGGILKAANSGCLGGTTTGTTVATGATLDINTAGVGSEPLVINGTGTTGQGALINSGAENGTAVLKSITLGSDATIGGTGRWDLRSLTTTLATVDGAFKLTKVGANQISFVASAVSLKDLDVNEGKLSIAYKTVVDDSNPGTITVNPGGTLAFGAYTGPISCIKPIVLNGGALESDSTGANGTASVASPISLAAASNTISVLADATLTLSGPLTGSGKLNKTSPGTLVLGAAPGYGGTTRINAGTLRLDQPGLVDVSTVDIAASATLDLHFTGDDTVAKLFIDDVQMPDGRYDSTHSSGRFTGTGVLVVGTGGSAYVNWETANGIAGAGAATDSDNDGIANGIEFVIGGDPSGPGSDSNSLLQSPVIDANNLTYVFRRTHASASYNPFVESSSNLTGWTKAEAPDATIAVEPAFYGDGSDKVTVVIARTLAAGSTLFVRLHVIIP